MRCPECRAVYSNGVDTCPRCGASARGARPRPAMDLPYARAEVRSVAQRELPRFEPEESVVVSFEGPGPQRRWTVALRLLLVIPHLFVFSLFSIALFVVIVIGWFAALVLGRLPDGMANFIGRGIQYGARVQNYGLLLMTDRYPSFSLDMPDYAVNAEFAPTRLNRAAVFFRVILQFPVLLVVNIINAGITASMVFVWLIVLVLGRLPRPVFEAFAAFQRFEIRAYAFSTMLTGEQPKALMGDRAEPMDDLALHAPIEGRRPRITRLALSRAGKRLLVLFIVVGVLVNIGTTAASTINATRATNAARKLRDAHSALDQSGRQFAVDVQQCTVSGGIECVHRADARLVVAFEAFDQRLDAIALPANADSAVIDLHNDVRDLIASLRHLGSITTLAAYQAEATHFQQLATKFEDDYRRVRLSVGAF